MREVGGVWSKKDGRESFAGIWAWPGWLGRGLLLVLCGGLGVTLKLPGVAILVRGAVVRDPVALEVHLPQASEVFHMNRWILQNKNICIVKQRLPYFESVMLSVACFAGGHRTMNNRHLERLNTHFRKLCRSIVVNCRPYAWHGLDT